MKRSPIWRAGSCLLALLLAAACATEAPTPSPTPTVDPGTTPAGTAAPTGTPGTPQPPTPAPEPTETASPEPEGWTLTIAFSPDISSLDPAIAYDAYSWPVVQAIYEPLLGYDSDGEVVPLLAESMPEVSEDGLTFTFTLRGGVQFVSRQGEALREATADDVVYSLNRLLNPNLTPTPSPVAGYFFNIIEGAQAVIDGEATEATGIRALDSHTVEIVITEPNQAFLNIMALPFASVMPQEFAGTDTAAVSDSPVGSGPFVLESYTPGQQAILVANPHYWSPDPGRASRVEYRVGVDPTAQVQQVQTGDLHIAGDPIPPGLYTATISDPRWAEMIERQTLIAIDYLTLDASGEDPLSNVLVRRAINHAIDKEHLLLLDNNRGVVAHCIFPTLLPGHNPGCQPYTYSVPQAQDLMDEAGFGDGFSTTLYIFEDSPGPEWAESISQDLAEIGITVEVVVQPFETLLETVATPHNAPMVMIGWFQDFPDPSDFVDPLFSCASAVEGGVNISWYCNEDVDALSAQARADQDPQRRLQVYQQVEEMIMADAPFVPLRFGEAVHIISDQIDFEWHPIWFFDLSTPRQRGGG
jgi:ABC-type transport system substrate-binding protein